jgi:glutamate 5-kinase
MSSNTVESRAALARARRLVIKIGSALLTREGQGLNLEGIGTWAAQMARLAERGLEVLLVTSGAVAAGMQRMGLKARPHALHELQAMAAIGQMYLVQAYETAFSRHGLHTAQVLLTHDDLADRRRYLNARSTLRTLLDHRVVPVINENDTVATEEIRFGDNDTLAALVANLVEADLLLILTDQAGLYERDPRLDPHARLIAEGEAGDPRLMEMAGGSGVLGRGGMRTKLAAAEKAARSGAATVIASGREPEVILRDLSQTSDGEAGGAQALARRSDACGGKALPRRGGGTRAARGRAQSAPGGGDAGGRGVLARRDRRLSRPPGAGGRPGARQLQFGRDRAHHRQTEQPDRGHPRLRRRAGAHPPRQYGHPVRRRAMRLPARAQQQGEKEKIKAAEIGARGSSA